MDAVQAMLVQLRRAYLAELPARLQEIERLIMALESAGYQEAAFNDLFRHVHSLKGSGGTHGLHIISNICHPLEDYLSKLIGTPEKARTDFADIALAYVDLLHEVSVQISQEQSQQEGQREPGTFRPVEARLAALRLRAFVPSYSALIVETSRLSVNLLTETLQPLNFRFVVLDDGYAALGRALAEPFDLLISAFEVKRLNGLALICALQLAQGSGHRTATLLLTANKAHKLSSGHPDFFVPKDGDQIVTLVSAVKSVLAGR